MAQPSAAPKDGEKSLADNLFEDMGRKAAQLSSTGEGSTDEPVQKLVEEVESLCMNCHQDGTTKILLTRIPFFREIIITSFSCPHCGFSDNEIQTAGAIQPQAVKYIFKVEQSDDLQRQVIKTDTCTFRIEDIDLEIPPGKGRFTNVEGILTSVKDDLASHQDERMRQMPETAEKVADIINSIGDMLAGKRFPFAISVDDPAGNSWIEPKPGDAAGKYSRSEHARTAAQNEMLGLSDEPSVAEDTHSLPFSEIRPEYRAAAAMIPSLPSTGAADINNVDNDDIVENQVYSFPASCPACTKSCTTNMKMVHIPHFKQVVLMSTVCEHCGYRSNEVKTGGEVPEKGRRISLRVESELDLARDVLKGESAALQCPELQLRVEPGTMGGRFTTVEGILTQVRRDLRAQAFGLEDGDAPLADESVGDSMTAESKSTWTEFFAMLTDAIEGRKHFTMILEDPLASSYIQSLTAPEPDPQIEVQDYDRTEEEEEELGLKDMHTVGYEQEAEQQI